MSEYALEVQYEGRWLFVDEEFDSEYDANNAGDQTGLPYSVYEVDPDDENEIGQLEIDWKTGLVVPNETYRPKQRKATRTDPSGPMEVA